MQDNAETTARIATVGELRAALADLSNDHIVVVDGYLYVGPGSTYGQEDYWECDECHERIQSEDDTSDEHLDWCSLHPANTVYVQHNNGGSA